MIKRITSFFKNHLHFKLIEVPLVVVFLTIISSVFYFVSNLPSEKNNYIAQEITILSKNSETGSVPMYLEQNLNADPDNSTTTRIISSFDTYNNRTSQIKEYKKLVCANLDDKEVKVNSLEDRSPAVIMTSWSTFYYDPIAKDNIFMSNLFVEGYGTSSISSHYFCYITSKQADYMISKNSDLHEHEDLINRKIPIQIVHNGKSETQDFTIRDIIKSNAGNDARYNELFGSYIVCYYLPFLKTTKYQMLFDLAKDENRNLNILNDIAKNYSIDVHKVKFLNGVNENQAEAIENELYNIQTMKDNSSLVIVLLYIPAVFFALTVFFICESHHEIYLSLSLLLFGVFSLEYIVLHILALSRVPFAVKLFTSSGILVSVGMLLFTLLVISISAFVKVNIKFNRKYVNEKNNK